MDENKIIKCEAYLNQEEEDKMLKEKNLERLSIKDLMALDYEKYKDYLPCRSNEMISYKSGETKAYLWHYNSKKKKRIPFPLKDGCYEIGQDGIPNGKPLEDDGKKRKLWRWQDRDYSGLLVRDDDYGDGRGVVAYCFPGVRFRVLAYPIGKRSKEKDAAIDWLKKQAKKTKAAKEILRRLNEGSA